MHAARERSLVLRLDEQVDVRALKADVYDPDPLTDRRNNGRFAYRPVHVAAAQASDDRDYPQHDVQRLVRFDLRSLLVRRPCPLALRRPPGALALPAVLEQLLLHMPPAPTPRIRHSHVMHISIASWIGKLNSRIYYPMISIDITDHCRRGCAAPRRLT